MQIWHQAGEKGKEATLGRGSLRLQHTSGKTQQCNGARREDQRSPVLGRGCQALFPWACSVPGWGCPGRVWQGWKTGPDPKTLQPETSSWLYFLWLNQLQVLPAREIRVLYLQSCHICMSASMKLDRKQTTNKSHKSMYVYVDYKN